MADLKAWQTWRERAMPGDRGYPRGMKYAQASARAIGVLLSLLVVGFSSASAAGAASAPKTPCPDDIPAEMLSTVRSDTAEPGQVFRFRVKTTTTVNGGRFLRGTLGYCVVRSVSKAGRHNQYGFLALEPRYLVLANDKRQEVSMDPYMPAVFTSRTPNLDKAVGSIPNPIPGLIMTGVGFLRFGRNVTIGPGYSFFVDPIFDLKANGSC